MGGWRDGGYVVTEGVDINKRIHSHVVHQIPLTTCRFMNHRMKYTEMKRAQKPVGFVQKSAFPDKETRRSIKVELEKVEFKDARGRWNPICKDEDRDGHEGGGLERESRLSSIYKPILFDPGN